MLSHYRLGCADQLKDDEYDLYKYLSQRFNDINRDDFDKYWKLYIDWVSYDMECADNPTFEKITAWDYIYNNW